MSFLAPWAFAVGVFAALGVVVLHLLSTRRPPRAVLPTARFVPESEARAVSRSSRPTDLLLLAARMLAALLIGAAFARPVLDAPGPSVRTVVLLDASSSVQDRTAAAREATERLGEGGAIVAFDTVVRALGTTEVASLRELAGAREAATGVVDASGAYRAGPPRAADGILSAALVAGVREARAIARGADSVRMVLVSPLAEELFDAATAGARAEWPGGITLVRPTGVADTLRGPTPRFDTPLADDPIAPALAGLRAARGAHDVRLVRRALVAADSAWVREPGRVLVHWPLVGGDASGSNAGVNTTTARADGVTAFGLRPATLVAPLVRLPLADSAARIIARWRDGAAAATERRIGAGCVREVGVGIPLAGDLTLRPAFAAFLQAMVEPCGGARGIAVSDSAARAFARDESAVPARLLTAAVAADATLAAWLLGGALLALAAEWMLRRRRDG